jgi:hypothetical protein
MTAWPKRLYFWDKVADKIYGWQLIDTMLGRATYAHNELIMNLHEIGNLFDSAEAASEHRAKVLQDTICECKKALGVSLRDLLNDHKE